MKPAYYNRIIILFFLIQLTADSFAQSPGWLWAKTSGGSGNEFMESISLDQEGNLYSTGYFAGTVDFDPGDDKVELTSNGSWDIFITKMDVAGNFIWAKAIGGILEDYGLNVVPDASGNIFISGVYTGSIDIDPCPDTLLLTSPGIVEAYYAKLDSDGNLIWAKSLTSTGGPFINSMVIDQQGGGDIYAVGRFGGTTDFDPDTSQTFNLTAGFFDIFIMKLDHEGNFLWARSFGGADFDVAYSMALDPSGNGDVYTTGSYRGIVDFDPDTSIVYNLTATGNQNMFLTKLDGDGNFVWAKTLDGPNNSYGSAITTDGNNVYTTGLFNGTVDFDPGSETVHMTGNGYDLFILKLDTDGNFVWNKTMGGANFDIAYGIAVDPNSGDIYTTGFFEGIADFDPGSAVYSLSTAGGPDIFVSRLDASGNFDWAKSLGGSAPDYGVNSILDASNHLYVAGYYASPVISLDSTELTNDSTTGTNFDLFVGKLEVSFPTAAIESPSLPFLFYPNPASEYLAVDLTEISLKTTALQITNMSGQIVLERETTDKTKHLLDIAKILPGTYFLRLLSGNQIVSANKFVKS